MATTKHVLTILAVQDLEAATRFYREAFDWPQPVSAPVYAEFNLPDGIPFGTIGEPPRESSRIWAASSSSDVGVDTRHIASHTRCALAF